jgi:anti-anti-sigma regulatory factor
MSFLKISDSAKRDLLVQELINARKNIMQVSISEKIRDIMAQQSLSKLFKPVTEKIETTAEEIRALPAITLPQQTFGLPVRNKGITAA